MNLKKCLVRRICGQFFDNEPQNLIPPGVKVIGANVSVTITSPISSIAAAWAYPVRANVYPDELRRLPGSPTISHGKTGAAAV